MSSFEVSEHSKAAFTQDLFSDSGAPERNPYAESSGHYRFLRLGFSFCQSRIRIKEAGIQRASILRLRSIQMSERLEMARALSWHHRYILRERARHLFQMIKKTPEGQILKGIISSNISLYKAKSDRMLSARHRGIHEYESHHPLLRQLEALELLSGKAVQDREFATGMEIHRSQVARRASKVFTAELKIEEEALLQLTDATFEAVYGLSERWSFDD